MPILSLTALIDALIKNIFVIAIWNARKQFLITTLGNWLKLVLWIID